MPEFGLVIHGGAGAISRYKMTPQMEKDFHEALGETLQAGYAVLKSGGSSLDAVQKAVHFMEDCPLFNAGKGAVFTHAETNEMDAAIMDGETLKAGAVAGVKGVKNPIDLARLVMEKLPHVLLARDGAEAFGRANGIAFMPAEYFHTENRRQQLADAISRENRQSKNKGDEESHIGTVGAVARDRSGNLAAATSTGGMTNSRFGRIGDTPIIGAGTYANNRTAAVSATGHGEFIIRSVTGYDISALIEYRGMSLTQACDLAIYGRLTELGGTGGLVAIDRDLNIALPFNTPGMYRGFYLHGGHPETGIYKP